MCNGITFQSTTIMFAHPDTRLPVFARDGQVRWVPWGKHYGEGKSDGLPEGACARLESIRDGRWKRWSPIPVKIPADQFSERGKDRINYWFYVSAGMVLQGLWVPPRGDDTEGRIYVVTVGLEEVAESLRPVSPTPPLADVHDRWPRMIQRQAPHTD